MRRIGIRMGLRELFLLCPLIARLTAHGADHTVTASDYKFTPSDLKIVVGETVTWTNSGGSHNVASSTGLFRNEISADPWQFQFTFNTAGTFAYVCQQHQYGGYGIPAMVGSVQVRSSNAPPVVAVESPLQGALYAANDVVTLAANATDDGLISHVEFLDGDRSLGIVRTSPFAFAVALSPGNHSLVANALDNNGSATMSTPVNFEVSSNHRPAVAVTSPPADKHIILPDPINLNVQVVDPEAAVAKVEYINYDSNYNISRSVATVTSAPFNLPDAPLPAGIARITAVVTDTAGFSSTSAPVRIFVSERIRLSIIQDRPGWFTFRTSPTFGTVTFFLSTDLRQPNWVEIGKSSPGGGMIENSFRFDQPRMLFRTRVD